MFSLCVLVLTLLVSAVQASSSDCPIEYHAELSGPELTNLYNSRVYRAERMFRPMLSSSCGPASGGFAVGYLSHSGVRVTLGDGSQWLIHKGRDYGISSDNVVVNADHMSDNWKTRETKDFGGTKTVGQLVRAGGATYNLRNSNCHHASACMMDPDKAGCS